MLQNPEGQDSGQAALPLWQRAGLLCLAYFFCAWLGRFISPDSGTAVSYWLPGGLFVAVLLVNSTRDWPWLMLAILPANIGFDLLHDPSPNLLVVGGFCAANIIQAGIGAWLVRRYIVAYPRLISLRQFFGVLLLAGAVGSAMGATIGATMLTRLHLARQFIESWKILWGGNVMAVLVLAPLILVFGDVRTRRARRWGVLHSVEAVLVFGGMAAFMWYVLVDGQGIGSPKVPVLIFVLWAGLRFGLRGASVMLFTLAILASFLTTHFLKGLAPAEITDGSYIFTLQVFIAVAAMVGLAPAIVLAERDQATQKLRESEGRFRSLTEAAFEGIVISENGKILDVNDQGLKMFGLERHEMVGREIIDLVLPASRAMVEEAIRSGSEKIYGHELRRKDGSVFFGEARSKQVRVGERTFRMTALRDITESKLVVQALRESEEKFSKAFRTGPDVMSITDYETNRYLEVNDAHEKTFGFKREEVIGRTPAELGIFKDNSVHEQLNQELKEHSLVRGMELRARTRDGRWLTLLHSAELFELGGRQCVLRVSHDITQRKLAEDLNRLQTQVLEMIANGCPLRETLETLLRMVEAQSPDMLCSILLLDADGVHLRHGAAPSLPAEFMQAVDGAAIGPCAGSCGTTVFRGEPVLVADISRDPLWADYKQLALSHGLLACWSTPIFDAQRKVLGSFAIYHRRTGLPEERHRRLIEMAAHTATVCLVKHRADESLKATQEALRATIENTPNVGVQWYDGASQIVFWNRASEKIFGWSAAEAQGCTLDQLIFTPEQQSGFLSALKKIGATGEPVGPVEFPFRHRDGTAGTVLSTVFRIPIQTGELRFVCMDVDITRRKTAEAEREQAIAREQQARIHYTFQLIASQEAERKRIAAELHDSLGQNLLLIKNLAQMSLRDHEAAKTYERVASINHLATQCIAEARQISRDLHPHQLDHLGLKRALEAMLESAAQASEIEFSWKLDDVAGVFDTDSAMNVYRILQESLNNILKHSGARKVRVELERDIHEVQLRVTDDGRGFAVDAPADNKKGMGLKNISERVRMLGGSLRTDSAPGHGTRMEVVIPAVAEVA